MAFLASLTYFGTLVGVAGGLGSEGIVDRSIYMSPLQHGGLMASAFLHSGLGLPEECFKTRSGRCRSLEARDGKLA